MENEGPKIRVDTQNPVLGLVDLFIYDERKNKTILNKTEITNQDELQRQYGILADKL